MKKTDTLITFAIMAAILGGLYYWTTSGTNHEWQEEVNLADGRTIVVEQKRHFEGRTMREATVSFTIPEISAKPIEWHEPLIPLVVNINEGKLYVVAYPLTKEQYAIQGKPSRGYLCYQWVNGAWKKIPFEGVPSTIYQSNMLIWPYPGNESHVLTLAEKNGRDYNGSARVQAELKRLKP